MTPAGAGWAYGVVDDPTQGTLAVVEVRRMSDGATVPADNVWQTDRTLRDDRVWLYEHKLHFVAQLPEGGDSYLLTFKRHDVLGIDALATGSDGDLRLRLSSHGDWLAIAGDDGGELCNVTIFDLRGMMRLQARQVKTGQAIYTGQLPPGVYQIVVTAANGTTWRSKMLKR